MQTTLPNVFSELTDYPSAQKLHGVKQKLKYRAIMTYSQEGEW